MSSNEVVQLLPLAAILVLMYVLLIRPAKRRQRDAAALQAAVSPGDEIMLTSGVFGQVVGVVDETVEVEIASGVVIKVLRGAVGRIVTDAAAPHDEKTDAPAEGSTETDLTDSRDPNRGAH